MKKTDHKKIGLLLFVTCALMIVATSHLESKDPCINHYLIASNVSDWIVQEDYQKCISNLTQND